MYCLQKASAKYVLTIAKMNTRHCKKKRQRNFSLLCVGVCQFLKNVLNEGSEHLEAYELQKSISHLTSHLIIITAVVFFFFDRSPELIFQYSSAPDNWLHNGMKSYLNEYFHEMYLFHDIYETYNDNNKVKKGVF